MFPLLEVVQACHSLLLPTAIYSVVFELKYSSIKAEIIRLSKCKRASKKFPKTNHKSLFSLYGQNLMKKALKGLQYHRVVCHWYIRLFFYRHLFPLDYIISVNTENSELYSSHLNPFPLSEKYFKCHFLFLSAKKFFFPSSTALVILRAHSLRPNSFG